MSSASARFPVEGSTALDRFLAQVLASIGRLERRRSAASYIRGLLSDSERKSVAAIAAHLARTNAQAMHHVLAQSPWDSDDVMRQMSETLMVDLEPDPAWVIREVEFPKRGSDSVGVARQASGPLGRSGNVQVAISLHHVGSRGNAVLGWRLFLPEVWTSDAHRCDKAEIPEETVCRTRSELALDLIGQALTWNVPRAVAVSRLSFEDNLALITGLEMRGVNYVFEVPVALGREASAFSDWEPVQWMEAMQADWRESYFSAVRIATPARLRSAFEQVWLLAERPTAGGEPLAFFLTNLPERCPVRRMARLAKAGARASAQVRELRANLGLAQFEGRSWRGWHHHVALVSVADAFGTSEALKKDGDWFHPAR